MKDIAACEGRVLIVVTITMMMMMMMVKITTIMLMMKVLMMMMMMLMMENIPVLVYGTLSPPQVGHTQSQGQTKPARI